ncbi:collagen alpha-1(III) chain-like [Lynx rufus]|uniref:collagen alpha-1(III) chain-like n=1 Tax=Lynx rufus TaxID=61384 RepID=UPI001F12833F|nr:collagen alpha-1(III) chain-like [Lynx rufus]
METPYGVPEGPSRGARAAAGRAVRLRRPRRRVPARMGCGLRPAVSPARQAVAPTGDTCALVRRVGCARRTLAAARASRAWAGRAPLRPAASRAREPSRGPDLASAPRPPGSSEGPGIAAVTRTPPPGEQGAPRGPGPSRTPSAAGRSGGGRRTPRQTQDPRGRRCGDRGGGPSAPRSWPDGLRRLLVHGRAGPGGAEGKLPGTGGVGTSRKPGGRTGPGDVLQKKLAPSIAGPHTCLPPARCLHTAFWGSAALMCVTLGARGSRAATP